jgi:hypothetical protein
MGSKQQKPAESVLVAALKSDTKLGREDKMTFMSLANIFEEDFALNLTKSSTDLAEETGLDVDTWKRFLSHPPIKRIIESFINEQIKKKADTALLEGKGTRDAINVRKAMIEAEGTEDNTRFVVIRLPDRKVDLNE